MHGALISAMVASTDALAASAVLKGGGGPEKLVILMEGEALLNDASGEPGGGGWVRAPGVCLQPTG